MFPRFPLSLGALACALALGAACPVPSEAAPAPCRFARQVPAVTIVRGRLLRGGVRVTSGRATATIAFCLTPGRVTRTITLVRLAPGAVTVGVGPGRRLRLVHSLRHGRRRVIAVPVRRPALVRIALSRTARRVTLFVNGRRRASALTAASHVYVAAGLAARGDTAALAATAAGSGSRARAAVTGTHSTAPRPPTATAGPRLAAPITSAPTPPATTIGASTTTAPSTTTTTPSDALTAAQASTVPSNPFAPTSFWNAALPANAPIDANSQTYVNDLVSQIHSYGLWMNTTAYSTPVYVVPADQPTVKVTLDTWGPDLQSAWNAVPIPTGAVAAAGTDQSMTVWQPATDKLWEFWLMHQVSGAWHARWGGEMDSTSSNPGYFQHSGQTNNWGATATGLPLLGGLITIADLKRGYINHALSLAVPQTEASVFSWPAQRTDGKSTAATALPEGIRFRLDPSINVASLGLPGLDRMIAQAAQTYGIVLRDTSGAVTFYAQDPTPTGSNPWGSPFDGWGEGTYLSWLPWSHMEALQTRLSG